jgi:hypothetical protein
MYPSASLALHMTVEAPDTPAALSLEHRVEADQNAEIIYSASCQIFTESRGAEIIR